MEEAHQAMLAVNDADHLAIAYDGHGHFTAAHRVVHHVVGIFRRVGHNFGNARGTDPANNALAKRQLHGFVNGAIVQVFGAVSGFLDPQTLVLIAQINHTVLQPHFFDAGRGNVPQNVLRGILAKHALAEIFNDFQLLAKVREGSFPLSSQRPKKPRRHDHKYGHEAPPNHGYECSLIHG